MWADTLDSAEGIITAIAMLITAIGGAILAVKNITKNKTSHDQPEVPQGQVVSPKELWIRDLRADAQEADQLRYLLMQAVARLSGAGLPYEDLLPPKVTTHEGETNGSKRS